MPQRNEPHNYPSGRPSSRNSYSSRAQSSRVPSSQRVNMPNARDELEREREMYSAHDPNQSALSPAQRYAQAQKNQDNRQYYWTQHPGDTGRAGRNTGRASERGINDFNNPYDAARRQNAAMSGQIPSQSGASNPAQTRGASANPHSGTNPSRTSRTPRVGEATLSGRIPRQAAPNASGAMPRQATPNTSGTMPRQGASATPRRNANQKATYEGNYGRVNPAGRTTDSSDFSAERYLSADRPRRKPSGSFRNKIIAGVVVLAVVVGGVFGFTTWDANKPVNVTINGQQQTISGEQRSLEGLLDTNTVSVTPGNYVAVDGSVMREGEGTRASATVNGETKDDLSTRLNEGDDVSITNGTDITEDFTESDPQTLQPTLEIKGTGAVHLYTQKGEAGEKVVRTGNESGKTAEVTTKEPVNGVVQYYNVNSNGDKVIALTFDDGPWDTTTAQILDILKENDAKATFYTIGENITGHEDLVKRAAEEGHEIGTHTWDHAEGSGQGVSLILMSSDERKQEVEKGMKAIKDASGQDASQLFRSPGGNFDQSVASDLSELITGEIGWNIDTGDWQRPGADVIAQRIESAGPGEIILMHDGGGDRSQTVSALKEALPKLKEQGYRFITVSELVNTYPYQEGE